MDLERKTKQRAPFFIIYEVRLRPRPPRQSTKMYDVSGRKLIAGKDGSIFRRPSDVSYKIMVLPTINELEKDATALSSSVMFLNIRGPRQGIDFWR
jgi:hypothetical protein